MKKKILFIINNLNCGGAEKALISLLEDMDYSRYEIDLFLFKHEGLFMNSIPNEVTLLLEQQNYKYFDMSTVVATRELIKKWDIKVLINRLKFKLLLKELNPSKYEQKGWKYVSSSFSKLEKKYDVAIGYLEKNPIYFCVDKVDARKKIGWMHNDYIKLGMDKEIDKKYFEKLDYIFTVSKECKTVLESEFPGYKNKFRLMHNIVSEKNIKKLAGEQIEDIKFSTERINIVSVGRLNYQKGFELGIEACRLLVEKKYPINWIIIGEGEERKKLQELIDSYNLKDNMKLIGIRENPYPYIKKSDIYVQPSRFEGKSIAIDEAKILKKPIVVTNFTTAKDQIKDRVNGLIVNMSGEGVADGITKLILDSNLKSNLVKNLENEVLDSSREIKKLCEVM